MRTALDTAQKTKAGPIVLISTDKRPWTEDGFRSSWRKVCAKAGVEGLTPRDLRGAAYPTGGATEIVTITGLSLKSVRAILDEHYLNRDPARAESTMAKLEQRKAGTSLQNGCKTVKPA